MPVRGYVRRKYAHQWRCPCRRVQAAAHAEGPGGHRERPAAAARLTFTILRFMSCLRTRNRNVVADANVYDDDGPAEVPALEAAPELHQEPKPRRGRRRGPPKANDVEVDYERRRDAIEQQRRASGPLPARGAVSRGGRPACSP